MKKWTLITALTLVAIACADSTDRTSASDDREAEVSELAEHPMVIDPWLQQAKLLASDGSAEDEFGFAVAVSGDTVVVGAYREDASFVDAGSIYVFEDDGTGFVQTAKIPNPDARSDWFGYSVAISGDTIVVGARNDDDNGGNSGSAYVYEDSGAGFVQTAKLLPDDGASEDYFGYSVAISGDTIVVGAWGADVSGSNSGSAYVFERGGAGFMQTARLLPGDGAAGDWFGRAVAVSGDTIVAGALGGDDVASNAGSAYVFEDSGNGFIETAKLTASDGAANDKFGNSVAVAGSTVVIAARDDGDNGTSSGSAYVFEDSGTGFAQTAKLTPGNGEAYDSFGYAVAVSGDTIAVGARTDDDNGIDSGSAYVFQKDGSGFTETAHILANDGSREDRFGHAVAVSGDTIVVGAYRRDDNGTDSGAAYIFESPNVAPTAREFLRADDDAITATEGVESTITLEGTDADGDEVTFEIVDDPTNGTLSITAADDVQSGTFDGVETTTLEVTYTSTSQTATADSFTYRIDDGNGGSDIGTVELDITLVNDAPSITSTAPTMATAETAYTYAATATDPEGDALTWATATADTCGGSVTGSTYAFTPGSSSPADCVVGIEVCDDGTPSECDTQVTTVAITPVDGMDPDGMDPDEMPGDDDSDGMPDDTDGDGSSDDTDGDGSSEESGDGCGCSSANSSSNGLLALVVLALLRLRRRRRKSTTGSSCVTKNTGHRGSISDAKTGR